MEQNQPKRNQAGKRFYKKAHKAHKAHKDFWRALTKSVSVTILAIFFLLGSFSIYDMLFPEKIPEIQSLGFRPEQEWVNENLNKRDFFEPFNRSNNWDKMQHALKLLDITCPEVSEWVKDQYLEDNIVYVEDTKSYARFDFLSRKLIITHWFFELKEGEKAVTLAHEYRHSIQNKTKFMKKVIFHILTGQPHENVVEDDAELFEYKVFVALHE
jgi:hypothetical protein